MPLGAETRNRRRSAPAAAPAPRPRAPGWMRALPNALTVLRLLLAAAFPFVAPGARLPVALGAGVSDALDGWLARRLDAQSRIGALLDGVADKAFVLSALGTLVAHADVAWWQVALVLARDLMVVVALTWALLHHRVSAMAHVAARPAGKLTTVLMFGWFTTLLWPAWVAAAPYFFWATAVASLLAAWDYGRHGARALRSDAA